MRKGNAEGRETVTAADPMSRRRFLATMGAAGLCALWPWRALGVGRASQVSVAQIVYAGGNWCPRPTALRRLLWEVHKRTAVDVVLEPDEVKAEASRLAASPVAYLAGDRPFQDFEVAQVEALGRFLRLGGTLIVDAAFTSDGDAAGFERSVGVLLEAALPGVTPVPLPAGHVLYRAFYAIERPVGRVEGPPALTAYESGGRLAVIRSHHDMGGAWARDNMGNWQHEVSPGGERQREAAIRLGVNMILYSLCQDYKDEEPHRRFGRAAPSP